MRADRTGTKAGRWVIRGGGCLQGSENTYLSYMYFHPAMLRRNLALVPREIARLLPRGVSCGDAVAALEMEVPRCLAHRTRWHLAGEGHRRACAAAVISRAAASLRAYGRPGLRRLRACGDGSGRPARRRDPARDAIPRHALRDRVAHRSWGSKHGGRLVGLIPHLA